MIQLLRDAVSALVIGVSYRVLTALTAAHPVSRDDARVEVLREGGQPAGPDAELLAGWRAEVRR